MLTLGCARNEVDSEELAGTLTASGWQRAEDDSEADVILVNTCGFVAQAKKDSIDTLLSASDMSAATGAKVVAVGCLAERYGAELAANLPEADAVLGFDHYAKLSERLDDLLAGRKIEPHQPVDRRTLLPITPVQRPAAVQAEEVALPGHGWGPRTARTRLDDGPVAPLKIASGCDRRCAFCAIPRFRGSFVSRPPEEILAEAAWLAGQGVRELYLVSENSTSYGKDLSRSDGGGPDALERLLPDYPDIKVELSIDAGLTDIVEQRFDAGVRLGHAIAKDMVAMRIGPDVRMAVVGTPGYFATHPKPKTPQDLTAHNCINIRLPTAGGIYAWEFKKGARELNVRVEGQLVFNTATMAVKAALAGIGLAFVPEQRVLPQIDGGELLRVLSDWCPSFSGFHLYYPSRRQPTPAFVVVANALRRGM